jgi:hypothetical protein
MTAGRQPITAEGVTVPRNRSTFRPGDLTRAFKAAKKAGVDVRVEIDLEQKKMTLTPVKVVELDETNETKGESEWDSIQ